MGLRGFRTLGLYGWTASAACGLGPGGRREFRLCCGSVIILAYTLRLIIGNEEKDSKGHCAVGMGVPD